MDRLQGSEKQVAWAREIIEEYLLKPMRDTLEKYTRDYLEEDIQEDARRMYGKVIEQNLTLVAKLRWTIKAGEWIKQMREGRLQQSETWLVTADLRYKVEKALALEKGMILVVTGSRRRPLGWGAYEELPVYGAMTWDEAIRNARRKDPSIDPGTLENYIRIRGYRK